VYHSALLSNSHALAYTTSRGLDADAVHEFRLGYAAGRLNRRKRSAADLSCDRDANNQAIPNGIPTELTKPNHGPNQSRQLRLCSLW
jgi:hypothetical protein